LALSRHILPGASVEQKLEIHSVERGICPTADGIAMIAVAFQRFTLLLHGAHLQG